MLINNRSKMQEDFLTPEESISPADGAYWEACMTFNGFSWGYLNSEKAAPYSYTVQQIIKMLNTCASSGGNLLLNIGPMADGTVPPEAIEPLTKLGGWLSENGEAAYGLKDIVGRSYSGCNLNLASADKGCNTVYVWNMIWPDSDTLQLGGFISTPKKITLLSTGENVDFVKDGHRIILKNLRAECPDKHAGIAVFKLEFGEHAKYKWVSYYPQMHFGINYAGDLVQ
jgi:alpha-L-fucosidase